MIGGLESAQRVSLVDYTISQKLNVIQGVVDRLGLYNIGPLVLPRSTSFIYDACSLHFIQVRTCARICSVRLRPSIPLHGSMVAQRHALGSQGRA